MNFFLKNIKNRYSDPDPDPLFPNVDPDPLLRKGRSEHPDPLFPNLDPRIRINVKMRWIRNSAKNIHAFLYLWISLPLSQLGQFLFLFFLFFSTASRLECAHIDLWLDSEICFVKTNALSVFRTLQLNPNTNNRKAGLTRARNRSSTLIPGAYSHSATAYTHC